MAGPACSVLSPTPFPAGELIQELVRLQCLTLRDSCGCWLSVENTHPIGGTYRGDGRPILWDQETRDAEDRARVAEVLGVFPKGEISLAAMCNQLIDHRVLGEVALWIAQQTNGFVDLGGCVEAPSGTMPGVDRTRPL